ncbi:MAG: hypothetical protein FJ271_24520 [Planctomycetes bacterium]|nr:hypothetical protein [Planctomycetota bacterium]
MQENRCFVGIPSFREFFAHQTAEHEAEAVGPVLRANGLRLGQLDLHLFQSPKTLDFPRPIAQTGYFLPTGNPDEPKGYHLDLSRPRQPCLCVRTDEGIASEPISPDDLSEPTLSRIAQLIKQEGHGTMNVIE